MLDKAAFIGVLFATTILTGCSLMQAQIRSNNQTPETIPNARPNAGNNAYNNGLLGNSGTNNSASTASVNASPDINTAAAQPLVSQPPVATVSSFSVQSDGEYLIGAQDLLEIQVFGVEELYRKVRVNSRGSISLPLIGNIQAAGLTSEQLEARIASELAKNYLQNPQVTVFIQEFANLRVTVEGAVKKPGIYPMQGQTTLLQSIALAEGPDRLASSVVKVFRIQTGGSRQALQFDLDEIRSGDIPDPLLHGDDIVVVETSTGKSVIHGVTDTLRGFVRPFGF